MADIQTLKRIYRLLSEQNALVTDGTKGLQPSDQITYLMPFFLGHATTEDTGDSQVNQDNFEGGSTGLVFRGSTALERSEALEWLIRDLKHEQDCTFNPRAPGWLTIQFGNIPH